MRSLHAARALARTSRPANTSTPEVLLDYTRQWIENEGFDIDWETAAFFEGGDALLSPDEGMLYVNEAFREDVAALLVVLAHERGHLEQHERVKRLSGRIDVVAGSAYAGDGAGGTARYHRRSREEAEATAFATEYVCPSDEAFDKWRNGANVEELAETYGIDKKLVRVQLAQALYDRVVAQEESCPMAADDEERKDDPAQKEAAEHIEGPALVRAGPGTGKTATLIRRLTFLLDVKSSEPESILVLTFSVDAAEEVRARVGDRFSVDIARRIEIQTFHGFGWTVLKSYGHYIGLTDKAQILDEIGTEELVRDLIGQSQYGPLFELAEADLSVRRAAEAITHVKDRVGADELPVTADHVAAALSAWDPDDDEVDDYARADAFLELLQAYEGEKRRRQRVDFADLIALPERILREQEDSVRSAYRQKYRWVLVDEYQDVSRTVARLLQQLCGPANPLWGVGDDHQAIYRFRGAAPENVIAFRSDFPDGQVYDLGSNYRACPELVKEACRLAALLDDEALEGPVEDERWRPEANMQAFDDRPVRIAEADSEVAEVAGVVRQVKAWITAGAQPKDIAVLGRRNVDVRDVVLALGDAGIRAAASALVTPEGAGGVLAAVSTVPDRPRPSLPRLAADLGRGHDALTVNQAITRLLASEETGPSGDSAVDGLVTRIREAVEVLQAARFTEDAFGMMAVYLFEVDALRPILDDDDEVRRALDLAEVVTSLTRAAGYRYTHTDKSVADRRLGFGQHFRQAVARTSPSYVPAPHPPGAVRVMTLHASKGLEFPLVALIGQVIPKIKQGPPLLPPQLRTPENEDKAQANAAIFVGATRAQQGLLVTYAPKKTPGTRPHQEREVPSLLQRWPHASEIPVEEWTDEHEPDEPSPVPPVWGEAVMGRLSASALGTSACQLAVYLGRGLRLEFPSDVGDLYPSFMGAIRRAAQLMCETPGLAAEAAFAEAWSAVADQHPHAPAYRAAALGVLQDLHADLNEVAGGRPLEVEVEPIARESVVQLGLARYVQRSDGTEAAVAVHARSPLAAKLNKHGQLTWSELGTSHKAAFAVMHEVARQAGRVLPELFVLSVTDRAVIPATWKRGGVDDEASEAMDRLRGATRGPYEPKASAYDCPDCEHRTICPFWLQLAVT